MCVELRNTWFASLLENNQLRAEAAAASGSMEALNLQGIICIFFAYVFFGLKGTCLPAKSLLGGVVRSRYKHCVWSR